ncbi:FAD binding domain-containing protein [Fusarium redolens]|uniref:FAD binding domain-containing protein n=1 Tax=Fusarium redolens TaxID=48865 RepID=A0A9P9FV69_FUSRE|nr:FAD binding domain-containing protein [Fusarium redolens]KAH7207803.1 FAD binding domain-containing protein [Fusarium redolens]
MAIPTSTDGHSNGYHDADVHDVCVVGAGPAGLMLSVVLAKLGLSVKVVDERPDQTTVGRADGIQPKTIETLQMLRIGDDLVQTGVKVHDICMWRGSPTEGLRRTGREVHYPSSVVDVLHPYILLCHQGMMEGTFINDLRKSGVEVTRSHTFRGVANSSDHLQIECDKDGETRTAIPARYLVGCDGARSAVRNAIPGAASQGTPHNSVWGVLDGELDTDFPDIWSKTVIFSEEHGSVLLIPRERNMTRLYIEMKSSVTSKGLGQEFVMEQARLIMAPYTVNWTSVEWFGNYQVSQRFATRFLDPTQRIFIAGDASHTHSPKAAQGMNTSVHDSWNLGWKLNLAARNFAKDGVLLQSYEQERKKIAEDLINFDLEHANEIAGGDSKRLAENFRKNTRFISGVGVEYGPNELNHSLDAAPSGDAKPGCNLPQAKVTRYIDACPVDVQLDVPILGQFRVYVVAPNLTGHQESGFIKAFDESISTPTSFVFQLGKSAQASYQEKPRASRADDVYVRPERYTTVNQLITFALLTSTDKNEFELSDLPPTFSRSRWTVYLDDAAHLDTKRISCTEKWLGSVDSGEVSILVVRPDGYVGAIRRIKNASVEDGAAAASWLDSYFGGFLQIPSV